MPDNPSYLHRLTAILAEAKTPKPIPFFRRGDIEALFGLKSARPINLMHAHRRHPGQPGARGSTEGSRRLAGEVAANPARIREIGRQKRVIERIVELKAETAARAVKIVLPDGPPSPDLPDGVSLQPGLLTVSFDTEQQLLERLFLLARLFAADTQTLSNFRRP